MKLFAGKAKQTIAVAVEPAAVLPGGTVRATVQIAGAADDKIGSAVARLVCRLHWTVQTTDSDGDSVAHRREEVAVLGDMPLGSPGQPGAEGSYSGTFVVPESAAHTAVGAVEWAVEADIDRRLALDVHAVELSGYRPRRRPQARGGDAGGGAEAEVLALGSVLVGGVNCSRRRRAGVRAW